MHAESGNPPPAEMSAEAKQPNMTQEITAMPRHVSEQVCKHAREEMVQTKFLTRPLGNNIGSRTIPETGGTIGNPPLSETMYKVYESTQAKVPSPEYQASAFAEPPCSGYCKQP